MALPVSPGGGTELTAQSCPTFSWSASEGAQSYRVEVYEQVTSDVIDRESMRGIGNPVVEKEIPAPALSWTPSSGECLSRGMRYVWYVEGVDAEEEGQWSGGVGFQVEAAALSVEQKEAVQDVVKGYLTGEGSGSETTSGTTEQFKTADLMMPMSTESVGNNFFGTGAGYSITSGSDNTFIGAAAGFLNDTGYDNSFLGYDAGISNTSGWQNSFLGSGAGYKNDTGKGNVFIGSAAGKFNGSGSLNTAIGAEAGYSNGSGYGNVFLGNGAGYFETGSNKLYIDNCYAGGSICNQPLIKGDFEARTLQIDGSLTMVSIATPSDIRYKKEIHPIDGSLEKVLDLRGVTYEWDRNKVHGAGFKEGRQIGLIAQEVEKVLPELVHTDSNGYKSLSYDKLGPVLIEAVKEQQKEIEEKDEHFAAALKEKDAQIERLQEALEKQKKSLDRQQAMIKAMMTRLAAIEYPVKTLALK